MGSIWNSFWWSARRLSGQAQDALSETDTQGASLMCLPETEYLDQRDSPADEYFHSWCRDLPLQGAQKVKYRSGYQPHKSDYWYVIWTSTPGLASFYTSGLLTLSGWINLNIRWKKDKMDNLNALPFQFNKIGLFLLLPLFWQWSWIKPITIFLPPPLNSQLFEFKLVIGPLSLLRVFNISGTICVNFFAITHIPCFWIVVVLNILSCVFIFMPY